MSHAHPLPKTEAEALLNSSLKLLNDPKCSSIAFAKSGDNEPGSGERVFQKRI